MGARTRIDRASSLGRPSVLRGSSQLSWVTISAAPESSRQECGTLQVADTTAGLSSSEESRYRWSSTSEEPDLSLRSDGPIAPCIAIHSSRQLSKVGIVSSAKTVAKHGSARTEAAVSPEASADAEAGPWRV